MVGTGFVGLTRLSVASGAVLGSHGSPSNLEGNPSGIGTSAAIVPGAVVAGAPGADFAADDAGALVVFDVVPCALPDGAACDDDNACTTSDTCTEGECGSTAAVTCGHCDRCEPTAGCVTLPRFRCPRSRGPGRGSIAIRRGQTTASDTLSWKLKDGETQTLGVGLPGTACAYAGPSSALLLRLDVPAVPACGAPPCLKGQGNGGRTYLDPSGSNDGITKIVFTTAVLKGKPALQVKGKGANLGIPTLGVAGPLLVQWQSGASCYESVFSNAQLNTPTQYRARSD